MFRYQLVVLCIAFIVCNSTDNSFCEFKDCYIKAVNRTDKFMTLYIKLYQTPVDNVTANIKLMRNNNGFKPFFLDVTIDACRFLVNQKNKIIREFYFKLYKKYSNMNHTCPYDHDLLFPQLWTRYLEDTLEGFVPLVGGEYALYTTWYSKNIKRASVNIYFSIF
ncbi:uncharacterized protein LOC115633020 [Scaptodrosophila lebanonensis]|uniref:Uncharacterized protein LOC115633020 n=1 Tax=Drosophila lebanonensis TaxID=7225 RepID=A0A6J2UCW5_DROLE|nr:uncharacterized protein LOC115633020 [Scaptodrosophila lebanonensis]